ncbi:F-box domain-containing protein [Pleurotus pulmonarius]
MASTSLSILAIIPPEIAEHALSMCRVKDVVSFSETCWGAYRIVHDPPPPQLWRRLFLAKFDDPRMALRIGDKVDESAVYNWRGVLIRRYEAAQVALGKEVPHLSYKDVLECFLSIVRDIPPLIDPKEDDTSRNTVWLSLTLRNSKIITTHQHWSDEHQLEAQLRAYVALGIDSATHGPKLRSADSRLDARRTGSRTYTYNLEHYKERNHYGPYLKSPKRRINWVHVEALMNVVQSNIREIPHQWAQEVAPPVNLEFLRASSATTENNPIDWAGVEGSWARYVCFMDYRELFAFNFTSMYGGPRNPAYFNDPSFREATRLIRLDLQLTSPDKLKFRGLMDTGYDAADADGESESVSSTSDSRYPTLYFTGSSKGSIGNEATIEGNVRLGVDKVPLWRFVSIYDGHAQWSSEGVQIGHMNSAMGVVGVWTSDTHDEGDPAGPFWFWKPTQPLDKANDFM